jgi:portal protein
LAKSSAKLADTAPGRGTSRARRIRDILVGIPDDEKDFLAQARDRFKLAVDAESREREDRLSDLRFATGDQWPQETKRIRDASNRPCMTINRYPAVKGQIVNEQRAQRPSIVVKPVGDGADVDDAEMLEGLLRHIQVNSDAEIAYDCGFEHMVLGGKGYAEICRDYLPGETMDQELYIKRVKNPFTIYCDPSSQEPDESDANWKFKVVDYPVAEYLSQFPKSQLASAVDFQSIGDQFPFWGDKKTIRVAEYWYKDWVEDKLYQMKDGSVIRKSLYDLRHSGKAKEQRPEIINERDWKKAKICCALINAVEIIDKDPDGMYSYTFPGKVGFIPLIPLIGEDFDVNGDRKIYGIVRNSKDAQRGINYFRSYAAETIALAPKAPWVGWKGQFKDAKWKTANVINYPYLEADVVTTTGQPAPSLPARNQFEPPIQGVLAMSMAVDQDFKATTGIYEPSLGQNKTDQSGKAIQALQGQSQLTNLNYTDNLSRFLRAVGRVLLDAAPYVYDAPRVQRIIQPDGQVQQVIVHSGRENAANALKSPEIQDVYDLSKGVYDVVVDVGPSYKTKREEGFALQMQLAEADKTGTIMKVCPDIIVGNSDVPQSREMAERLKKTVPPQYLDPGQNTDPKVALAQATATLRQLEQQNQHLMQQNSEMMQIIKEEKIQAAKDIEVANIRAAAQVETAGLTAKIQLAQLEFEKFVHMSEQAHEQAMASTQQEHEKDLAESAQEAAQQQAQQQASQQQAPSNGAGGA